MDKYRKSLAKFWNSGLAAKIITIFVSVVVSIAVIGCCCLSVALILPTPSASVATTITLVPSDVAVQQSTSTMAPTSTTAPTSVVTLLPTVDFPTFAVPSALATVEIVPTVIPTLSDQPLLVHFIDVGQGDATLIQTPDGKTVLIDGGDTDSGVMQYLQSIGVQRIDLMIATHPHADHIGGLVQVLKAYPVTKVVTNGQPHTTSVYENFLDAISSTQAEYVEVKRGDVIQLGNLGFLVLNPPGNAYSDLNGNSLVLQFSYGQTTFLMMGDADANTESALLASGMPLKADILKVGHHGSATSSTTAFLNAVRPDVAIFFAGVNNTYGHPAPQTIASLTEVGATIYGTNVNGTITVKVSPGTYEVQTQKSVLIIPPVVVPPTIAATAPAFGGLEIVSVTSPVSAGANATLTAKTSPNASCSITVYYKSGPSSASGLGPRTADANGMVSWTWKVGTRTTPGTWSIVVNCNGVTKETTFTVQ